MTSTDGDKPYRVRDRKFKPFANICSKQLTLEFEGCNQHGQRPIGKFQFCLFGQIHMQAFRTLGDVCNGD